MSRQWKVPLHKSSFTYNFVGWRGGNTKSLTHTRIFFSSVTTPFVRVQTAKQNHSDTDTTPFVRVQKANILLEFTSR